MNAFFDSQPNYCPLVRMCHSRTLNNKIIKLHEGCIRVNIQSQNFNFQDKDSFISIFMRNIQILANEMCKVANDTSLEVTEEVFNFRREIDQT